VFLWEPAQTYAGIESDRFTLTGPEGKHATTVRRLKAGERVDITDGAGLLVRCEVVGVRPGELDVAVRSRHLEPEPPCRVVVIQAILKGDRGELAVELMTEVGVDEIVPWAAERCVARWRPDREDKALSRWRSTAREAAKQSRRARFPVVTGQAQTADVIKRVTGARTALLLDPAAGRPLASIAATAPADGEIMLIVGPEGGLSAAESAELAGAGALPVRLGPTVLRGSTAGAVAAALVLSACGRWDKAHTSRGRG
jgi:16S rRNA (uracil1498-N3)-methyltransferase